jgi:hypothetical protein
VKVEVTAGIDVWVGGTVGVEIRVGVTVGPALQPGITKSKPASAAKTGSEERQLCLIIFLLPWVREWKLKVCRTRDSPGAIKRFRMRSITYKISGDQFSINAKIPMVEV